MSGPTCPTNSMPGPRAPGRRAGVAGSPTGKHDSCLTFWSLSINRGSTWVSHSWPRLRISATRIVVSVATAYANWSCTAAVVVVDQAAAERHRLAAHADLRRDRDADDAEVVILRLVLERDLAERGRVRVHRIELDERQGGRVLGAHEQAPHAGARILLEIERGRQDARRDRTARRAALVGARQVGAAEGRHAAGVVHDRRGSRSRSRRPARRPRRPRDSSGTR